MFMLLIISFYTSRVILQQLGIDDFGTFNLVASIIIMFTSLRHLIASSTQRFLNYDMGCNNNNRLQVIFNLSIYINICIAITFFIIVELIGLWFFKYKINIDPSRFNAAFIVFQCSTVGSIIGIFTTSLDAVIIAHEKMDVLAIVSTIDASLKLGAALFLAISPYDKLIQYGVCLMIISGITFLINYFYCRSHFKESKLVIVWDKTLFYEMIGFAGWNFLGKSAAAITQSAINMILNVFGGPIINAARGIAFQLNSATCQFVNNVNIVFDPFFIKTYASKNYHKFYSTFYFISKALYFIQLLLVIPFYYLSEEVLMIWLGQIPDYSIQFLRLILLWSLIRSPHSPIDKLYKATGNIMLYQIMEGIILALPIPVSYILLKSNFDYSSIFVCMIIFEMINLFVILVLARKQCAFPLKKYFPSVIVPIFIISIPFTIGILIKGCLTLNCYEIIMLTVIVEFFTLVSFLLILSNNERNIIYSIRK